MQYLHGLDIRETGCGAKGEAALDSGQQPPLGLRGDHRGLRCTAQGQRGCRGRKRNNVGSRELDSRVDDMVRAEKNVREEGMENGEWVAKRA